MVVGRALLGTVVATLLVAAAVGPATAQGVRLVDGNDCEKSSEAERRAYIVGVANTLALGNAYETGKLAGQDQTFMGQAVKGLQASALDRTIAVVDRW
jgi:hypothetical protein